jgi:glycosyltransferase involved in cell wall biosynthesis
MKPKVSIIVISYNMNRELPRTLLSLSVPFQKGITRDEFEVILIDNGSKVPPTASDFSHLDIDLRVVSMDNPTKSPVPAINFSLKQVNGEIIGVYIDGARIASPRLIASARDAITYNQRAFVGSRGRYLGNKFQRVAIVEGYNQQVEDDFLVMRICNNPSWVIVRMDGLAVPVKCPVRSSNKLVGKRIKVCLVSSEPEDYYEYVS